MKLFVTWEEFGLYYVSQKKNGNGKYRLEAFSHDSFSLESFFREYIDEDNLNDGDNLNKALDELLNVIYENGGRWYKIDHTPHENKWNNISLNDHDSLRFENIISEIDTNPWFSQFYILVNAELTEYHWFVAKEMRIFSMYRPDEEW